MAFGIVLSTLLIASSSLSASQGLDQAQLGVPIRIGAKEFVPGPAIYLSPGTVNPEFSPDSNWVAWAASPRDSGWSSPFGNSLQELSLPGRTVQNVLYRLNTSKGTVESCLTCPSGEQLTDYRFLGVSGELVATTRNDRTRMSKLYFVSGPKSNKEILSVPDSTDISLASSPNSRTVFASLLDRFDLSINGVRDERSVNNLRVFRLDSVGSTPVVVPPGRYREAFFSGNTKDGSAILEATPENGDGSVRKFKVDYRSGISRLLAPNERADYVPTNGNNAFVRLSLKALQDFPDRYALYVVENRKDTRAFEMSVGVRGILGNTPDQKVVVYWNSEGSFCRWLIQISPR